MGTFFSVVTNVNVDLYRKTNAKVVGIKAEICEMNNVCGFCVEEVPKSLSGNSYYLLKGYNSQRKIVSL
jgi:hypothetical protein